MKPLFAKPARSLAAALVIAALLMLPGHRLSAGDVTPGMVRCANLIYGKAKTSKCFSAEFLKQIAHETHILTEARFAPVKLESGELYQFPFAIMTGEDKFVLTAAQRENMRNYLTSGGFIVASAGCSDPDWTKSFRKEIAQVFPDVPLVKIDITHPLFHTVYEIHQLDCKGSHKAVLEGLEIDGKIVLIFSSDGLNDTGKAGGNCCCCGGNEILNARQVNVNLLAYTLTH